MIHYDMPAPEYHAATGVSKSAMDQMARSPAHYKAWLDGQARKETPAMRTGSMVHCAVLEPGCFASRYAVAPQVDKRTSAGKTAWAEFSLANAGKIVVTPEEHAQAQSMANAILATTMLRSLVALAGPVEASAFVEDPETGLVRKCRPDKLIPEHAIVVDLKTTDDASEDAFNRSCATYRYHVQAAYYLDTLALAGLHADSFVFLVVEKSPPHIVASYVLDDESIALGRRLYRRNLDQIADCLKSNTWPGPTGNQIKPLHLPAWAWKDMENAA